MEEFLNKLKYERVECSILYTRSIKSLVEEWRAHNLLYKLGLFKSHTKDVDLNNESKVRLFIYKILSKLYF